ncbi:MAG: hypothetical protein WCO16_03665 [bacterium]
MKKFLNLMLIFSITTAAFFFLVPYFNRNSHSGFEGVVEGIIYLIIWGTIFLYQIIRLITSKKAPDNIEVNTGHSVRFSLLVTLIILGFLIFWILAITGVLDLGLF